MSSTRELVAEPRRAIVDGAVFVPLRDGSFVMYAHDDDGETEEIHVPAHLALAHYPELAHAHDDEFGAGQWGRALPLTFENAPRGGMSVVYFALRPRTVAELEDFFLVLYEMNHLCKEPLLAERPAELAGARRASRAVLRQTLPSHSTLTLAVAELLVELRARSGGLSTAAAALCTVRTLPV